MRLYKYENIPLNQPLTIDQLCEALGIKKNTFSKNRQQILEELDKRFVYHVKPFGHYIIYTFTEDKGYIMPSRDEIFQKAILNEIKRSPANTPAHVARKITQQEDVQSLNYKRSTVYQYTRIRMNDWFGKRVGDVCVWHAHDGIHKGYVEEKIWCFVDDAKDEYVPMAEEQVKKMKEIISKAFKDCEEKTTNIYEEYLSGIITKEERREMEESQRFDAYLAAKQQCEEMFGYRIQKVSVYILFAE